MRTLGTSGLLRGTLALARIRAVQEISGSSQVSLAEVVPACRPQVWFDCGCAHDEASPMSFVAWQILRRLPKPLLLIGIIFVLVAAAKA